jgi:hypothetical protein
MAGGRHRRRAGGVLALLCLGAAAAAAQPAPDPAAQRVFDARLAQYRGAAPDEILDLLRQRVTTLAAPLPGFDPGSRLVDLVVEHPWTALRRRCPVSGPLGAAQALALAEAMLREGRLAARATAEDRGSLAAMLAALDGRLCRCASQPSLALAADCAS